MTKKNWFAALLAGSLALTMTACGGDTNTGSTESGDSSAETPYEISMILKTNASEFWQIIQAGAEAYEEEHPDLVKLSLTTRNSSTP